MHTHTDTLINKHATLWDSFVRLFLLFCFPPYLFSKDTKSQENPTEVIVITWWCFSPGLVYRYVFLHRIVVVSLYCLMFVLIYFAVKTRGAFVFTLPLFGCCCYSWFWLWLWWWWQRQLQRHEAYKRWKKWNVLFLFSFSLSLCLCLQNTT